MNKFDGIARGVTYYFNVNWSPAGSRYFGVSRYGSYMYMQEKTSHCQIMIFHNIIMKTL